MCRLKQTKTELRQEWKEVRRAIPERPEKNRRIRENFLTCSALKQAKSVFLYLSFGDEVETIPILEELFARGIRVLVPRCHRSAKRMDAVEITAFSQVNPGTYGILEPDPHLPAVSPAEIDVAVVPALAFDQDGFRLGYGGGYYDRFLAEFSGVSVGLAFSDCVTERLPREPFDKPVDTIITET